MAENKQNDLLWKNISSLPYFRGFLRAVEGRYYRDISLTSPLLDLGIGDGHFSATTFPGAVDFGIDPSYKSLQEAFSHQAASTLCCAKGHRLPFPDVYFSTVVSNSVLEHIPDLKEVLIEVRRVLKRDGDFIICVPNDQFTQNLSVARLLNALHLRSLAVWYQRLFNKISRHYHPDSVQEWQRNLSEAGFQIVKAWNYFPPKSLAILEWGHLFGIPAWLNKQLFGRWILFPKMWNLWPVYKWLDSHYRMDQTAQDGAYSFFIMKNA